MIIEVDGGKYEQLDVVRETVKEKQTIHPVLWDDACCNTDNYGVTAWPFAYLIGTDGRVLWEGNPSRVLRRKKPRQALVELLENELKKVDDSKLADDDMDLTSNGRAAEAETNGAQARPSQPESSRNRN